MERERVEDSWGKRKGRKEAGAIARSLELYSSWSIAGLEQSSDTLMAAHSTAWKGVSSVNSSGRLGRRSRRVQVRDDGSSTWFGSRGDEEEEIQAISVTDRFTEGSIMY